MGAMRGNDKALARFVEGVGPGSLAGAFAAANPGGAWPAGDAASPQLRRAFEREFKSDAGYAKHTLTPTDLTRIANNTFAKFYAQKGAQFQEVHPGLATYAGRGHVAPPRVDSRAVFAELIASLTPSMAGGHALSTEGANFRNLARRGLEEVQGNAAHLGEMAYEPRGWNELNNKLLARLATLGQLEAQLGQEHPVSQAAQDLQADLATELQHQQGLVAAKLSFIQDVANKDPLSAKAVAYSNLLWAQAVGHAFDQAIAGVTARSPLGAADPSVAALTTAKAQHIRAQTSNYNAASTTERVAEPTDKNKKTHPAMQAREVSRAFLKRELQAAGLPKAEVERLTSTKNLNDARREALNTNQTWAPYTRQMVVTKDGVTRTYQSSITPGADISPRFARRYQANVPLEANGPPHPSRAGVSSAEKADHYHARNLKVSELQRPGPGGPVTMAKVIGHGVLDSWNIPDPAQRTAAANRGAHEVLEAGLATNDRIRGIALNRQQQGDNTPVRMTHVSVNLTTPAGWRELPGFHRTDGLHDYQEQTYTQSQFEAFRANSSQQTGGPISFELDDGSGLGQDVAVPVTVRTISFSFGINPIATGRMPDFMGGWDSVYEHNRGQMAAFVGDLGARPAPGTEPIASLIHPAPNTDPIVATAFTAPHSRVQGRAPGGFIGSVMDQLDSANPQQAALATRMQRQTDTVRNLFLSDAFKQGNGDPAKMGREILALQALAEEALNLVGSDQAATMSKGCKSDKDRGGVTDVELKHKLITEDMGGEIIPDAVLEPEDQENYYVVAAASGQLENQAFNTGLPGSKEAGKLTTASPALKFRTYLKGLGALASE